MIEETVNIAKAKKHFSELLGQVAFGKKHILITKRGKPVVRRQPLEDRDTELRFELLDLPAQGGLADETLRCRVSKMPGIGDGDKVLEVSKVHGVFQLIGNNDHYDNNNRLQCR